MNTKHTSFLKLTCIPFVWRLGPPDCQFNDGYCENVDKAGDDHERGGDEEEVLVPGAVFAGGVTEQGGELGASTCNTLGAAGLPHCLGNTG